jgi:GTP 3',8-cyclase
VTPSPADIAPDFDELFSVVELEAGSRCNRTCEYCPVSLDPRPSVPVKMSRPVFDTLVGQLADVHFAGRISYHFYNEPLLRKDLDRLVGEIDRRLPDALQVLYTNGDLLDDSTFERLLAAGVDYFIVTRHSGGDFPERRFQIVQRAPDLVLTNRGGTLTDLPAPTAELVRRPCFAPSEMLIVTVTGDVLLCYEDARREHVFGNILDAHVAEIWRSPGFRAMRQQLAAGRRSQYDICSRCTNAAHSRPGLSQVEEPFLNATTGPMASVRELKRASVAARRR